jgi:hypothetical protein
MSWLSSGAKKVRRALKLPPITLKNVATKYAPAAIMAGTGNPMGAAGAVYSGAAIPNRRPIGNTTFPTFGPTGPGGRATPTFPGAGGGTPNVEGDNPWWQDLLGDVGDLFGKGVDYAKENPMDVAIGGLAGLSALNAAESSRKAGKYQQAGLSHAKDRWAAGEPLRTEGQRRLLNPERPDLSSVYNDPLNTFSRPVQLPSAPRAVRRRLPTRNR